jgi:uncharacterized membrane protein YccC
LTALLILKPDFYSTVVRSVHRVLGTGLGVVVATLLLTLTRIHLEIALAIVVAAAVMMYAVLNYNYAVFTLLVTVEIVALLSFFEHLSPMATIRARLLNTMIGAVLAVCAHLLWPRWQRTSVPKALYNFMRSNFMYFDFLMAHSAPGRLTGTNADYFRTQLSLAQTNAESSVSHLLRRNDRRPVDATRALGILNALQMMAEDLKALEDYLIHRGLTHRDLTVPPPIGLSYLSLSIGYGLSVVDAIFRDAPDSVVLLDAAPAWFGHDYQPSERSTFDDPLSVLGVHLQAEVGMLLRMLPLTPKPADIIS